MVGNGCGMTKQKETNRMESCPPRELFPHFGVVCDCSLRCDGAQQLMPPLRLLRHLRPCHPPGGAHQARCASKTARVDSSISGDEAAQHSPGPHHNASRGTATQTTEPGEEHQNRHGAPIRKEALLDHQRKVVKIGDPSKPPIATNPTQADVDNTSRGDQMAKRRRETGAGQRQRELVSSRAKPTRREGTFIIHKYVPGESQRPEHTLLQNAQAPQQEGFLKIENQLQYLFQEVKKLQDVVGAKIPPARAIPIPPRTRTASQTSSSTANTGLKSTRNVPIVNSQPSPQRDSSPRSTLYRRAWLRYRKSIYQLVTVANALEGMSSRAVAPIASAITHHLRGVAQDAFATNDQGTIGNLGRYKWGINALIAGLDLATPAKEQVSLPANHFSGLGQRRNPARESHDNSILARDGTDRQIVANMKRDRFNVGIAEEKSNAKGEVDRRNDGQGPTQQIHSQSRLMSSSDHSNMGRNASTPPNSRTGIHTTYKAPKTEVDEPSLLDELFPESSSPSQPRSFGKRDQYPKLDPPAVRPVRRIPVAKPKTWKEQVVESFQKGGEQVTALQLSHCSTELTEADFRRVIPRGKHIETWRQDGGLFKIIPGRDPLSLERMPFYYILFKDSASALAYQKNASRLHKLSALHQPSSIFSAIPPPKGFLEDGEDLNAATSSYNLLPTNHEFSLSVVMQPYNPALRALLERGGYQPIMPDTDAVGKRIWKVLMHIDGYEPTPSDLFKIFRTDAFNQGLSVLTIRNESRASLHRLRDIINLRSNTKLVSSISPRAYGSFDQLPEAESHIDYEDPGIQFLLAGADEDTSPKALKQMVMNRVYNRWVIDFADEDSAIRFARRWHRRVLPDLFRDNTWAHGEDVRMCNTEVLW